MALLGDVLVRCRENGPDPASFLSPPNDYTATAVPGGKFPDGTYYLRVTALNPWGESLPAAAEAAAVVSGSNNAISVTGVQLHPGSTGYRVYVGQARGQQTGYVVTPTAAPNGADTTILKLINLLPGVPPVRATAMLPDTDGGYVSAWTLYRWLNNALQKATKVSGGIPLLTGIQAVAGQGIYRVPGKWIHFSAGWFDGWPVSFGRKSDVFIRQNMSGLPGLTTMEQGEDTTVIQMWPQPNRTGTITNVMTSIGVENQSVDVYDVAGFLSLGLVQIDDEIMSYYGIDSTSNTLGQLLRGIGGTLPANHADGANVTELNIRLSGFRLPPEYAPGDSARTLPIPPAWEEPLADYLTAQFKKSELDNASALQIEKQFEASIRQIVKEGRPRTGPSQIGSATREVYPGGYGGGILLP